MVDTLPIAGWYPDPELAGQDRWWDGTAWSTHRRPTAAALPTPVLPTHVLPAAAPPAPVLPAAGPSAPWPAVPSVPAAPAPSNTPALVGFILALTGLLLPFVINSLAGGIVATIGLTRSRRLAAASGVATGRGFAIAGILVGFIWGALTLLVLAAVIAFLIWAASQVQNLDYSGGDFGDSSNSSDS